MTTLPAPLSPAMTFEQMVKLAEAVAKSGLFGVKTSEQALALMAICEAAGMHPATAVMDYHIVQGRPAMKAEAMLARFLRAGGTVEWHEHTDQAADATFSHPAGGKVRINWTILMAKTAGLVGKDVWKSYPRAMLHARCVSEGVRAVFPNATGHTYTPEEVMSFKGEVINGETGEIITTKDETKVRRQALGDKYVKRFRDALDMDPTKNDIQKEIYNIHQELNAEDQDLYKDFVWKEIHSKDRAAIKKCISDARADNGANTTAYLESATGQKASGQLDAEREAFFAEGQT